jgi:hypothetical protein
MSCVVCLVHCHHTSINIMLTYLLTPWSRFFLATITGFKLVKKFPAFYGNRMRIDVFTSARHLCLSWDSTKRISPGPRLSVLTFRNKIRFHGEELLAPRLTLKPKDHAFSVVRDWLFNTFAATIHTGGRTSVRNLRTLHERGPLITVLSVLYDLTFTSIDPLINSKCNFTRGQIFMLVSVRKYSVIDTWGSYSFTSETSFRFS